MSLRSFAIAALCLCLPLVNGCDQPLPSPKQKDAQQKSNPSRPPLKESWRTALEHYHAAGLREIDLSIACLQNLTLDTNDFLLAPDTQALDELRAMALHCHRIYQPVQALTAGYSALETRLNTLRWRIDSRPITPHYVDYTADHPHAGIPNDPAQALDRVSLITEQGLGDQGDVVLGFEVLLFLLEGEHRYQVQLPPRSAQDYLSSDDGPLIENNALRDAPTKLPPEYAPRNRRRVYLQRVLEILLADLTRLKGAWESFTYPTTQAAGSILVYACIRNWHSVEASLPAEDVDEVTARLVKLFTSDDDQDIARLLKLDQLDGWPNKETPLNPTLLTQSLGQWLVHRKH
ncbi:hypothetical protein HDN1F_01340 [gamma proteobacterium HdN1]|nr:hypothetical protein HDN1F_01340 [gamma proteobacterium HdN1]